VTYDNEHTSAEDTSTSNPADSSSEYQDSHTRCYGTDERSEFEYEYGKDDDMFRGENLGPLGVDEIEAE
jgi:hypothetical protein